MKILLGIVASLLLLGGGGLAWVACHPREKVDPGTKTAKAGADDGDAVAALEKAGARMKRDASQKGKPVVELVLFGGNVDDKVMKHVAGLPRLRSLTVQGTRVTDAGLAPLAKLEALETLILEGPELGGKLTPLAGLTKLATLNLRGTAATDEGMRSLAKLSKLQSLTLRSTRVTSAGMKHLAALANLRGLDLAYTDVGDEGLKALAGLEELRELVLKKGAEIRDEKGILVKGEKPVIPITNAGLVHLAGLKKLERLDVSVNPKITNLGLKPIGKLTTLKTLVLDDTGIDEEGLDYLRDLKSLTTLELAGTRVLGRKLAALTSLEELTLSRSPTVRDAGLEEFKKLKKLKALRLDSTSITDKGVEYLAQMPALEDLDLQLIKRLTGDCIDHLKKLKTLKKLKLNTDKEKITKEKVEELQEALPRLQVET